MNDVSEGMQIGSEIRAAQRNSENVATMVLNNCLTSGGVIGYQKRAPECCFVKCLDWQCAAERRSWNPYYHTVLTMHF